MSKLRLVGSAIWVIISTFALGPSGAGMSTLVALGISVVLGIIFYCSKKYVKPPGTGTMALLLFRVVQFVSRVVHGVAFDIKIKRW